ncbi:FAD/NAD-P-binding domain-containing protein [Syncephalis fuscata]|nr:FAD/NAD-P-binding domain-containing protein [Syncephalis fuscata]
MNLLLKQTIVRSIPYCRPLSTQGSVTERLVILGSGWAGFRMLRSINRKLYDVVLVSPRNHFVFTPLLASSAVGTLEFRCVAEPIRAFSHNVTYYEARCKDIDFTNRKLHCTNSVPNTNDAQNNFTVDFDRLVIAVGAQSNTFNIPGVQEHALALRDVHDARQVRRRIIDCFEKAAQPNVSDEEQRQLLHFAVVGGGPTGIELSAELTDLVREDLTRSYPHLSAKWRLSIYDVAPRILGGFDASLSDYTVRKFSRQGIEIRTGSIVERVKENALVIKDVGEVPFGMLVWSTGLSPNPLIDLMDKNLARDRGGRLITDNRMSVIDKATGKPMEQVYAIGDCATIQDSPLPATAQVANQEAGYLSRALNKLARKRQTNPEIKVAQKTFTFHNLGMMAYIGGNKAIAEYKTPTDVRQSGLLAWIMWRSAYLTYSVSWRNKFLIPMHWIAKTLFGRDLSRF